MSLHRLTYVERVHTCAVIMKVMYSSIRLQKCALCVLYSSRRSNVAAMSGGVLNVYIALGSEGPTAVLACL